MSSNYSPGLGLYSGIFALYLQCPSKKSNTATILFYSLCFLYVLSAVNFVSDFLTPIFEVSSNNFICKNIIYLSVVQSRITTLLQLPLDPHWLALYNLTLVQTTASGCCDFLAQSILVRMNHWHSSCPYHPFYSPQLNSQRSTVVGSCGVRISVS